MQGNQKSDLTNACSRTQTSWAADAMRDVSHFQPWMRIVKSLMTILMIVILNVAIAFEKSDTDMSRLMGFEYEGEAINPKCVNLLQTWISESTEFGIITSSIIIDSCQDSNLAFEGKDYSIRNDGTVSYYEDPDDGHSYFGYRVVGRTLNNVFVLFHSEYIGLYSLTEQDMRFDFSKNKTKTVKVLAKLSETYMPCFDSALTRGNKLIIIKSVWESSASRAARCTDVKETLTFDLGDF
jgi:hypothetical protein